MSDYYVAIVITTVLMLLVISVLIYDNQTLTRKNREGFYVVAMLIIIAVCAEFSGVLLNGTDSATRLLHIAVKFVELSIAPAIPVVCGIAIYPARYKWLPLTLLALHAVLELLSAFFGFIYYVDAENIYHHCAFYSLYIVAYLLGTVYLLIHIVLFSRRYQNQKTPCLVSVMLFIFAGIICQAVDNTLRIVWLTVAIGFSLFYIYYGDLFLQIDILTGLLNRGAYDRKTQCLRKKCMILFFDIDRFKQINDSYGHNAGDECLKTVSQELLRTFGKLGLCYRFGGDEFCVITSRGVSASSIDAHISSYLRSMDNIRSTVDPTLPYISIGYADYNPGDSIEDAVGRADKMMYEYKRRHHSEQ